MNKYGELKTNTIIIAVANIGSKAITFVLAPLYSYYLTAAQYGVLDLITTTVGLLMPLVCLDVFEATFRYASDKSYDPQKVFSTSMFVCFAGFLAACAVVVPFLFLHRDSDLILYTSIFVMLEAANCVMAQFERGVGRIKVFAMSGLVPAVAILLLNLLFIVFLKLGLTGWLISVLLSKAATMVYLVITTSALRMFSFSKVDKGYIKESMAYCIPLIPTATMWWIMNASDRYLLTFFAGTAATGLYAVSNKLPGILSVFENTFYQAWQTSAINSMDDRNRNQFYSKVFFRYFVCMAIGVMCLLMFAKPLMVFLFDKAYHEAWKYMAPLILGVVFHALSGNLGIFYTVFKKTRGALYSTAAGAAVNVLINLLLIPRMGIMGASVATLCSFVVTFAYRWFDIRRFIQLSVPWKVLSVYFLLLAVQTALFYIEGPWSCAARAILACAVLFANREILSRVLRKDERR